MTTITKAIDIFSSRLSTLEHLLNQATAHFENEGSFLQNNLIEDMHPLGSQVAFTCDQPRNFARWLQGQEVDNIDSEVPSLDLAMSHLGETKRLLSIATPDDALLSANKRVGLGPGLYADMTGEQYLNEFLFPNFYFHLVTAYSILRMAGLPIGKQDYMQHLMPYVKQG